MMKLKWMKEADGDWVAVVGDLMIRVDCEVTPKSDGRICRLWESSGFFAQGALTGQQYNTSSSAKRAAERALERFLEACANELQT